MLTIGSLFSGIGGLELGLERAGLGPVLWQVESDPWCRRQLARHYPDAERFDDVTTFAAAGALPDRPAIICGGFPCQDVSAAGLGAGLSGRRSGLWREFARIVGALAPEWVVVENVASGAQRWVDSVVRDLAERGYESLPVPVSAASIGAPHRRERIFIVARRLPDGASKRRAEGAITPQLPDVAGGGRALPNADGGELRQQQQRLAARWAPRAIRDAEQAQPCAPREPVAHGCGEGFHELRPSHDNNGEQQSRNDPHGCAAPVVYPPRPNDLEGWREYLAAGGPAPGVESTLCGSADGLPTRMDRSDRRAARKAARKALAALGNAVVPECAEVAGWIIRELHQWPK